MFTGVFKSIFFILSFFFILYIITMQIMRKKTMSLTNVGNNEVIGTVDVYHVDGLPLPDGAQATVRIFKHFISINNEYQIQIDKISDIRLSLEKDSKQSMKGGWGKKNFINATGLITITYISEENDSKNIIFRQHRFDVEKRGLTGFYHILTSLAPNIPTEENIFN